MVPQTYVLYNDMKTYPHNSRQQKPPILVEVVLQINASVLSANNVNPNPKPNFSLLSHRQHAFHNQKETYYKRCQILRMYM